MRLLSLFALTLGVLTVTVPVQAKGMFVDGSIGGEFPVGQRPDRPQDSGPMLLGTLKLHNVMPHFNVYAIGQYQLRTNFPDIKENRFLIGCEYEFKYGFTVYGYGQRWTSVNDNRFVTGVKWNFKSSKF